MIIIIHNKLTIEKCYSPSPSLIPRKHYFQVFLVLYEENEREKIVKFQYKFRLLVYRDVKFRTKSAIPEVASHRKCTVTTEKDSFQE